jgi:predicted O-methyltransferase YrrM
MAATVVNDWEIPEVWTKNDRYHCSFLVKQDNVLDQVTKNMVDSGIDYEIAVSPAQGKFLHLLAKSINAKRILEVGTLGG